MGTEAGKERDSPRHLAAAAVVVVVVVVVVVAAGCLEYSAGR